MKRQAEPTATTEKWWVVDILAYQFFRSYDILKLDSGMTNRTGSP